MSLSQIETFRLMQYPPALIVSKISTNSLNISTYYRDMLELAHFLLAQKGPGASAFYRCIELSGFVL